MSDLTEIYAYTARTDDGVEALAILLFEDGTFLPLVAQNLEGARKLKETAVGMYEESSGRKTTLVRFTNRETVS
jgi:hypothetical protein